LNSRRRVGHGLSRRILAVIDRWSRESVSLESDLSLTGRCRRPGASERRQTIDWSRAMNAATPGITPLRQRMMDDMRMRKLDAKTQSGQVSDNASQERTTDVWPQGRRSMRLRRVGAKRSVPTIDGRSGSCSRPRPACGDGTLRWFKNRPAKRPRQIVGRERMSAERSLGLSAAMACMASRSCACR
jgi:hypothetical protein